ncbi:hypothetical protein ILYODFUR_029482 [Ilyodon furcidens]|uniref:Uncharacterized protein n=1 Tax=Ilyodon furcidens TaxID=33524 RepID=A0ABV0UNY3_9TELE
MAVSWTGENGFLDHPKPIEGEKQIFYPAPPKTVLPNPKLRDWDLSLSERTSNILKNLERKLWITSYQVDFTGPSNPLKTDDFKEKISTLTGINLHSVPLRERSYRVLFPSKPEGGHGQRQQNKLSESSYIANSSGLQLPAANQITASSYKNQQQPQELMTNCNEAADMPQMGHSQSESKTDFTDAQHTDMSLEILQKQQPQSKSTVGHAREGENRKVRFNERPKQESESKSSQDVALHLSNMQQHFDPNIQLYSQRQAKVSSERNSIELQKDDPPSKKEQLNSVPNASILPWPPVLPGIPGTNSFETEGRTGTAHSLLDLQNSFSKSEAHQRFSSSITHAAVNLRNNVVTGKRHIFYGINCNHIHG